MSRLTLYEVVIDGRCVRTVAALDHAQALAVDLASVRWRRTNRAVQFGVRVALPEGVAGDWRELVSGRIGFDSAQTKSWPGSARTLRA